jgi:hypothetical protein
VLRDRHPFRKNQLSRGVIAFLAISMGFNILSGFKTNPWSAAWAASQLWTGTSILLLTFNGRFFQLFYLGSLIYCIGLVIVLPRSWLLCGFPHGLLLLVYASGRKENGDEKTN